MRYSAQLLFLLLFGFSQSLYGQDTLKINLSEFIEKGINRSGQVAYQSRSVELSQNRAEQTKSQRFFPRFEFNSQHGIVPGVISSDPNQFSDGQLYLDPNLENDWENWAVFTRAEIRAVQPVYAWGAVGNAIEAAKAGARAAGYQFSAVKAEAEFQLYQLYYGYLLSMEIERILNDASDQIQQVERQIERMREEGDPDLKESDVFKFEIYRDEFEVNRVEVAEAVASVERIWSYILSDSDTEVYVPEENFLDPVSAQLEPFDYYQQLAFIERAELKGVEHGIEALKLQADAVKAQQYPMLFLGISGSYANTPNRPRQTNPFIINNTNFASAAVGFGIRQNLNFSSMKASRDRANIEFNRVRDLRDALSDNIVLELNETYQAAVVAGKRVEQTEKALVTARNWVRNEQLNYDIGFGDVEDLLDAVQKELELRLQLKQNVFDLNKKIAALYKAAGIPLNQLSL